MLAGVSTAWALLRQIKPRQVVLTGALTMVLLSTALFILGRSDSKESPWVSFRQYFQSQHFEDEWKADSQTAVKMGIPPEKLTAFKDDYKKYFYDLLPGWIASVSLVFGLLNYYLLSFVLSRITPRVPKAMLFREWMIPEPMVFGLIIGGALKVVPYHQEGLDIAGSNLLLVFAMIYVLGGFSIVSFFLHKWRLPATLRVLSYLILVQLPLDTVCALAVLDIWFDFRKIKNPKPEPTAQV